MIFRKMVATLHWLLTAYFSHTFLIQRTGCSSFLLILRSSILLWTSYTVMNQLYFRHSKNKIRWRLYTALTPLQQDVENSFWLGHQGSVVKAPCFKGVPLYSDELAFSPSLHWLTHTLSKVIQYMFYECQNPVKKMPKGCLKFVKSGIWNFVTGQLLQLS